MNKPCKEAFDCLGRGERDAQVNCGICLVIVVLVVVLKPPEAQAASVLYNCVTKFVHKF